MWGLYGLLHSSEHDGAMYNPLVFIGTFLLLTVASAAVVYFCYMYSAYVMLIFLALVAVTAAYALFDSDLSKLIASFMLYAPLVAPFFIGYSRVTAQMNIGIIQFIALFSVTAVAFSVFFVEDLLQGSSSVELLRLAKKFLRQRRLRYFLSVLSMLAFTAGVTSLALFLPPYTLIIPFAVVVCVLAVTMFGNVYEHRREIFALAAVGLNPDRLAGLFLVEALIIGLVGGGVGYAVGLSFSILASLPLTTIELSTGWITTVLLASVTAALTASIKPSLEASMLATPSLLKRWWHESPPVGWPPACAVRIPVKVHKDNVDSFMNFFLDFAKMLERRRFPSIERAEDVQVLKFETPDEGEERRLTFRYIFNEGGTPTITTQNELTMSRRLQSKKYAINFTVKAVTHEACNVYRALERIVSTYRQLAFKWPSKGNPPQNPAPRYGSTRRWENEYDYKPLLLAIDASK